MTEIVKMQSNMKNKSQWELRRGGVTLGILTLDDVDQPWFYCHFEPTEAFEEIKPLFDEELHLLEADEMDAWDKVYEAILSLGLRLQSLDDNTAIEEFLLHIDGNQAWFRY